METLCATCCHDKYPSGCKYACMGVLGWDEENKIVTNCEDYEKGKSEWVEFSTSKN